MLKQFREIANNVAKTASTDSVYFKKVLKIKISGISGDNYKTAYTWVSLFQILSMKVVGTGVVTLAATTSGLHIIVVIKLKKITNKSIYEFKLKTDCIYLVASPSAVDLR